MNGQGEVDSAYGQGLFIYLETYSADSTKLGSGTYTYDDDSPFAVNTFDLGFCPTNYDGSTGVNNPTYVTGGSFTVSSSRETYTITFDLTNSNGDKVIGTFKGKLDLGNNYL